MYKRIISLVLILSLLPACLAVPALADENAESIWVNVLDYGLPEGYSSNYISLNSSENRLRLSYSNPSGNYFYNYDIVFRTDASNPRIGVYSSYLTVVSLGDGLYRAFGSHNYQSSEAYFIFLYDSGTFLEVLSFKASTLPSQSYSTTVSGNGVAYGQTNKTISVIYPSGPTYSSWDYSSAEDFYYMDLNGQFNVQFTFTDWKKYDRLDLQLGFICQDIQSVSGYLGNQVLDLEVSYFDNGNWNGQYFVFVSVDISNIDRTSNLVPTIIIAGNGHIDMTNSVVIRYASGHVNFSSPNVTSYWFSNLYSWLSSGFSSVTSGLVSLGSNISSYISTQTSNLMSALVSHQETLIDAEKAQHEADRQLWNTISSNVGTWISNQTTAITNSLSTINSSITTFRTNVDTWITNQTTSITNSISSWGQSLKDSIDALPDKIAEALKDLVVPEDGAIESMATKSEELVSDRFGGVFEGAQIVDNWASQLEAQAATQILTIPVVNMNILGKIFPIGGWEVDLVPDGFEVIFESVKLIIDILATAAFINGIKSRLERTLEK